MKYKEIKLCALASGVALGLASMSGHAIEQPILPTAGAAASAVFSGGATINNGANFLSIVPNDQATDLIGTIKPAAADVGKAGGIVVIVSVDGALYIKNSGGLFFPWDASKPVSVYKKTSRLAASEPVTVLEGLVGADTALAGTKISAYIAYYTGDLSNLTYSSSPMTYTVGAAPASTCPTNTTAAAAGITFSGKPVCNLTAGRILTDTHLTSNFSYLINGTVFMGENVDTANDQKIALTIDAGTTVFAAEGFAALVIDKSAKIHANGSPANPIIMTSELDVAGVDAKNMRGKWGGLVINGRGALNTTSRTASGEGSTGIYGSPFAVTDDDSGNVNYVQIKYAGYPFNAEDELNSLALQGVGAGTNLDYIQIHNGADDGIEFYGGNVNAKHLLLSGIDDDALDWTTGYTGKIQHVIIDMTTSGDNCVEADNLGSGPTNTPRSIPTVSNLTCVLSATMSAKGHAFELKAGTGMLMSNSVIGGTMTATPSLEGCILIAGAETFSNSGSSIATLNGTLVMRDSIISSSCGADLKEKNSLWTTADWYGAQANSTIGTVDLGGKNGWVNGSALNAIPANIPGDKFFDQVDYVGAVKDESSDWTKGWIFTSYK